MKRRLKKQESIILQPKRVINKRGFLWDGLEVRESKEKNGGFGLFVTCKTRAGTVIPMLGALTTAQEGTHLFNGRDGLPSLDTYQNVGNFGLSITMMANEPAKRKPNCLLKKIGLVVASTLPAGSELLVFYGPHYNRQGYSIAENTHLDDDFPMLERVKLPSQNIINSLVDHWDTIVVKLKEPNTE